MWQIFKEVAKNPIGKKCLIYMGLSSVAALLIPKIFGNSKSIIMFAELALCLVISYNVNRFSQMMSIAQMYYEDELNK